MKTITVILILICSRALAQDSLKSFNYSRNRITTTGMEVLGSWAIVNMGVGATGWAGSAGGPNRYFYQMTFLWNTANLGAAILGYTGVQKNKNKLLTASETLKEQKKIGKIFLINGGLDVVYIGTGIYLKHRGDANKSAQLIGYGSSVIIQGAFLLLFDGTMYHAQRDNERKLMRFLGQNTISFNGSQIGIIHNL
jgi:hypothetical protein